MVVHLNPNGVQPSNTVDLPPASQNAHRTHIKPFSDTLASAKEEGFFAKIWNSISSFFSRIWDWMCSCFSNDASEKSDKKSNKGSSAQSVSAPDLSQDPIDLFLPHIEQGIQDPSGFIEALNDDPSDLQALFTGYSDFVSGESPALNAAFNGYLDPKQADKILQEDGATEIFTQIKDLQDEAVPLLVEPLRKVSAAIGEKIRKAECSNYCTQPQKENIQFLKDLFCTFIPKICAEIEKTPEKYQDLIEGLRWALLGEDEKTYPLEEVIKLLEKYLKTLTFVRELLNQAEKQLALYQLWDPKNNHNLGLKDFTFDKEEFAWVFAQEFLRQEKAVKFLDKVLGVIGDNHPLVSMILNSCKDISTNQEKWNTFIDYLPELYKSISSVLPEDEKPE